VETGRQLKQNLMGSADCGPHISTVPDITPRHFLRGLSFHRSWGCFFGLAELAVGWWLARGAGAVEAQRGRQTRRPYFGGCNPGESIHWSM
jgi:hypothetical protein